MVGAGGVARLAVATYSNYQDTHTHSMWDLVLYNFAVATFIFLYWFHKPKTEGSHPNASKKRMTESNGNSKDNQSKSADVVDAKRLSLRGKAKQRIAGLRRRKELVERDIIINLGLNPDEEGFEAFCDRFSTFECISEALVQAGFCSCDVIIGIDFTASNEWQGKKQFSKTCLHKTNGSKVYNPYQKVLQILGKTLSFISSDHLIHSYGFGDAQTRDHSVFPLTSDETSCNDYRQVINAYTRAVKSVELDGPTNFAPIIDKAIEYCQRTGQYHILIILVDGQVSPHCEQSSVEAIVRASEYPLSIIAIGVGDGPFGMMFEYDDGLPRRKFDNLQFVNFHRTVTKTKHEAAFALHALMELPDQYKAIQQLGYLSGSKKEN